MIQRSATCVFSMEAHEAVAMKDYAEDNGSPRHSLEDVDLSLHSVPMPLLLEIAAQPVVGITARYKAYDKARNEELAKTGFNLTWSQYPGGPEIGPIGLLAENLASGTSKYLFIVCPRECPHYFSPRCRCCPDDHRW